MKDMDFDELDRAVSSLMSKTPDANDQPASPAPASPEPTTDASDGATAITVTNNSKPVVAEVATTPALAQKRSGRFMDMVPGSRATPASPRVPSREGVTISPTTATVVPDPPTETSPPEAVAVNMEPATPSVEPEVVPAKTDWPDPLAVATDSLEETTLPPDAELTIPNEPLGSPFLADAKVEKRPLNSDSLEQEKQEPLEDLNEPLVPSEDGQDEPPAAPPIQAELNSDLIAIESNELKAHDTLSDDTKEHDEEEPIVQAKPDEKSTGSSGPTSIVQQYKEQPSSEDQNHAAIYDSSHFPEPLAHPAKKSSGWLWVLWVVLLLAVGAGGAVALYSLGIIT